MSSERELEIVRIGKQLEKLANSDTPVRSLENPAPCSTEYTDFPLTVSPRRHCPFRC